MKEYKIGEHIEFEGITYICVKSCGYNCYSCKMCSGEWLCDASERVDGENVHFEIFYNGSEKDKLIAEMVDILKRCEMTDEIRDAIKKAEETR